MESYRLEDMVIKGGTTFGDILQQFARSENIHFWAFKDDTNTTISLPALLLTDTRECYIPLSLAFTFYSVYPFPLHILFIPFLEE